MNWVKKPTEESRIFWEEWLRRHPESHKEYNLARGIIERINFRSDPSIGARKEIILDEILKDKPSLHYKAGKGSHISIRKWLPTIINLTAASVILILMATFFYSSSPLTESGSSFPKVAFITKKNKRGQKSSFTLPDKTKVTLNSESSLRFASNFQGKTREVFLEGEAYFDVSHDSTRPFLVHSNDIITEVHGTTFNVSAYAEENLSVALASGLVSVYPNKSKKPTIPFYLKPGEMLTVRHQFERSKKSKFDYNVEFGWKDGQLIFKKAGLRELITSLERWYNVNITVKGSVNDSWRINGNFTNESLENVLKGISYARNIKYELKGDQVIIML